MKTLKDIFDIDEAVAVLYKKNPDLQNSKFGYAYNSMIKFIFIGRKLLLGFGFSFN